MGSDNSNCRRTGSHCSAGRFGLMAALFVIFMIVVGTRKKDSGSSELRGGQSQAATNVNHFDNYDWRDLPQPVKNAAIRLGYNRNSWDNFNEPPPAFEKSWVDLNDEEQISAATLGFNEQSWCDDGTMEQNILDMINEATSAPTDEDTSEGTSGDTSEGTDEDTEEWTFEDADEGTVEDANEETNDESTSAPTGEDTSEGTSEDTSEGTDEDTE